ncbi:MAG: hypothetical protein WA756_22580, partial [Pseudolabrys sp.]
IPNNPQKICISKNFVPIETHNFHCKHLTIFGRGGGKGVRGRVLLTEIEGEGNFGEQIANGLLFLSSPFNLGVASVDCFD